MFNVILLIQIRESQINDYPDVWTMEENVRFMYYIRFTTELILWIVNSVFKVKVEI